MTGLDQVFVWPWMGIVANIQTQLQGGRRVGGSGANLRHELTEKGFDPVKVIPLWNHLGHSGFAIVQFRNDWDGFKNAIMFEKHFEVDHCGKEDYYNLPQKYRGERLYGWFAREDDYHSKGIIGDHLRRNGDLKSISEKEAEDSRRDSKLVTKLTNTLQMKHEQVAEMEMKCIETTLALYKLIDETDAFVRSYNEEIREMQQAARNLFEKISLEHEKATRDLEAQRKELDLREKELQQREFQNENEMGKLQLEKKMNERAILEQKKADKKMLRLAEEQKSQKEKLHKRIHELEKKLDAKQALELEIESMKGALQVMKHMGEDEDEDNDVEKKMEAIRQELKEKEEELDFLETLNQDLIIKERKNNDELQDARKELINGFSQDRRATIGVKIIGELDGRPFLAAAKRKFSAKEPDVKERQMCSLWDNYLRDPSWHPYRIITYKEGYIEEIINDDDEKLKELKSDIGDEVYNAVPKALINEYKPSGRHIVKEIWHFKDKRKASLKEGVAYLLEQWKKELKRRKT